MTKNIAIIDDELTVRETIKEMLCTAVSSNIYTFSSVDEFLVSAAQQMYDLIISDIHMPSGSGLILVEHELSKNIPLVFMSGFSDFIPKSLNVNILRKPLTINQLMEVVGPILDKSK